MMEEGKLFDDLTKVMQNNTNLVQLNLKDKNLPDWGFMRLSVGLENNSILTELDLTNNKINITQTIGLAKALGVNQKLVILNLENTFLGDDKIKSFGDMIAKNCTITNLNLSKNGITYKGAEHLAQALQKNQMIKILNLDDNQLGDKGVVVICSALPDNRMLSTLKFAGNQISKIGLREIFVALKNNETLLEIYLENNNFDKKDHLLISNEFQIRKTIKFVLDAGYKDTNKYLLLSESSIKLLDKISNYFSSKQINDKQLKSNFQSCSKVESVSQTVSKDSDQQSVSYNIPGLIYKKLPGDDHCFYHAVGLYVNQEQAYLRSIVAAHLEHNINDFVSFIQLREGQTIENYIRAIREGIEWAGQIEIKILMRVLDRPIIDIGPNSIIWNQEALEMGLRGDPIFVLYNGHNHYDAFIKEEGISTQDIINFIKQSNEHSHLPIIRDRSLAKKKINIEQTAKKIVVKKAIAKVEYGINYKKSDSDDLPTESQVTEILTSTHIVQKNQKEENYSKPISDNDLEELIKNGYTEEEVMSLNNLGATAIVLKKLNNPAIELNPSETIECINTFIKMGMVEAAKVSNQNLVLIVGYTGVGKSTAVNYLHGCEMEKINLKVISVKKTSLIKEVVTIGHANSKTFIPTVIPSPEMGISFCDCPGFFDNRGQEINIANAVNIRNIIENAETIKIILLIDYHTACDPRQLNNNNLKKMLIDLFGTEDKLNENLSSIQLGITQVPLEIDGTKITLEDIKSNLIKMKYFPEKLCTNAKIMDPLNRRTFKDLKEFCSREDWLSAIKEPPSIKKNLLLFNTILIPDDKLKLQEISERICKEISKDLDSNNHIGAAKNLEQMRYLKIINHKDINELYENALKLINRHSERMVQDIKGLADDKKFVEVIQMMKEYQQFIIFFKEAIPELTKTFIKLLSYIRTEQSKYYSENANDLIAEIAKYFHQNPEIQLHLSYSLHRLLNHSQPAISDPQALHYLAGYLKELITLDTNMAKLVTELSNCLAEFTTLAIKLEKRTIIEEIEKNLYEELNKIAKTAYHIHRNSVIEKLKSIKIVMLEQLDKLNSSIFWENNGKNILSIIYAFENDIQRKALVDLLAQLACEPSIKEEAQSLQEQLIKAEKLTASIEDDDVEKETLDALQLPKIVKEKLLEIKGRLVTKQKEEEVKTVIKDIVNSIEQNKFDVTPDLLSRLSNLTEEQLLVIKQDKTISQLVKEKLKDCLTEIESNINWETNGKAILEILKSYEAPMNRSKIDSILTDIQTISNIQLPAIGIYVGSSEFDKNIKINNSRLTNISKNYLFQTTMPIFTMMQKISDIQLPVIKICNMLNFLNKINYKICLQLDNFITIIDDTLTHINSTLKNKQIEINIVNESCRLVVLINNELLPNNRFDEVNKQILRLIEIAPENLKMITLEKEIEKHQKIFSRELGEKNYESAKYEYKMLIKLNSELSKVFVNFNIKLNLNEITQKVLQHIDDSITTIIDVIEDAFSYETIKNNNSRLKSLVEIGEFFNAVSNFNEIDGVNKYSNMIIKKCVILLNETFKQSQEKTDYISYAKLLMQTQCLMDEIGPRCIHLILNIKEIITASIKSKQNEFLVAVSNILIENSSEKNDNNRYANKIISDYPEFKRAEIALFRAKSESIDENIILKMLKLDGNDRFRNCYHTYSTEYKKIVDNIINTFVEPDETKILLKALKKKARQIGKKLQNYKCYYEYSSDIATMLANIFGVWSYLDAHKGGFKRQRATLKEPHPAQAMSVLLLLNIDKDNNPIQNRLLQVQTGEGKSIIIAAASVSFALLGYNVYVACYNPWLASRDKKEFTQLFAEFKLEKSIIYGDFDYHISIQANKIGNLKELVLNFLRGLNNTSQIQKEDHEKSLLLIDEVDVFFSEKFLGNTCNHGVWLTNSDYENLLKEVWKNRNLYLTMNVEQFTKAIRSHSRLEDFLKKYPNVINLIDAFIIDMYRSLSQINNGKHNYVCSNKKIGYIDQVTNTINYETQYDHLTSFAAIKEYENNQVDEACLNRRASIVISYAKLSYAKLPNYFKLIMGVSGTLSSFSIFENNILKQYNIKEEMRTIIPSIFLKQPLTDAEKVTICWGNIDAEEDTGYFYTIRQAVNTVLSKDRAILIIFENEVRLNEYEKYINTHQYTTKNSHRNKLLTGTEDKDRDTIVSAASRRNTVTMMIREFGRGTDFVCRDSQLRNSGGVAVICTFFPEHAAEEIQIKGRTCRQNDPGSFEMILFHHDIKKFNIHSQHEFDQSSKSQYKFLLDKRAAFQADKANEIQIKLGNATKLHEETLLLSQILTNNSSIISKVSKFILPKQSDAPDDPITILKKFNK